MGTLYVVATPIGNLEDVTLRALRILREVPVVAAEDTRVTRKLLAAYDIQTPLVSFHEHTTPAQRQRLLQHLETGDLALVTDAGTPVVSDPGFRLVRDALDAGHTVVPLPGPSAALTALAASGLPPQPFSFHGFLPRTTAQRRRFFRERACGDTTVIAFESPHRVVQALKDLVEEVGPDRPVAIGREMTKLYEELFRGTAGEALAHYTDHAPRGEFTLVVAPPGRVRKDAT